MMVDSFRALLTKTITVYLSQNVNFLLHGTIRCDSPFLKYVSKTMNGIFDFLVVLRNIRSVLGEKLISEA